MSNDHLIPLTEDEARFVAEYRSNGGNGVRAAQVAWPNKTYGSAAEYASKMLKRREIVDALMGEKIKVMKRSRMDATRLLNRIVDEMDADINDIQNDDGTFKPVKEWPLIWRQGLVAGWKTDPETGQIIEIKLSDRKHRLDLAGKHVDVKAFERDSGTGDIHIHIDGKDAKL